MRLSLITYTTAYICFAVLITVSVYFFSYRASLTQLEQTGTVRLEQARDRLLGQLSDYRQLVNIMSRHPRVKTTLSAQQSNDELNSFLLNNTLLYGADDIILLDKEAKFFTHSTPNKTKEILQNNFLKGPHIKAALNGRLGFFHSLENASNRRKFYFARSILNDNTGVLGIVVVEIDVSALEFEWRIDEEALVFFDNQGVAFLSNRPSTILLVDQPNNTKRINSEPKRPFFSYAIANFLDFQIWNFDDQSILPEKALVVSRYIPQIDMNARVFLSTKQARYSVMLQTGLVASLLSLIGLGLWVFYQRRVQLAELLAIEEAANIQLEKRVEKRTSELRSTQHQLVQASKLSALGQLSAGISHELNQPLAAIKNFSESGGKLIGLNRIKDAQQNFDHIIQQIDRITRMIKSLRAFARKEKETIEPVDLQKVISASLNLLDQSLNTNNVTIEKETFDLPIMVLGGEVRLQQVVINLITNAIDALSNQKDKRIKIFTKNTSGSIHLYIQDNGPGIKDTTRIFEPFYSTKEIGSSKGLGLGMSISYGIIGSFGGNIECKNLDDGGAEFIVTLRSEEKETMESVS